MTSLAYRLWTPDEADRALVRSFIVTHAGDERRFWVENGAVHVACDWWDVEDRALFERHLPTLQPAYSRSVVPYTKIPFAVRAELNRVRIAMLRVRTKDTGFPATPVETRLDQFRRDMWMTASKLAAVPVRSQREKQLVLTHDLDEQYGWPGVAMLRGVERELGLSSAFGILSERYRLDEPDLQALIDEGCEVFSHGYLHDGTLAFLPAPELRRRLGHFFEAYPSMRGHVRGFRSGQLVRSPHMFEHVAEFFDYDMSVPTAELGGPQGWRTGCGTTVPFVDDHGLPHLPLTLPQDYFLAFIDKLSSRQITAAWVDATIRTWEVGGVAVILVHPDNVRRKPSLLEAYRNYLVEVLGLGAEVKLPGEIMTSLGVSQ